LTLGRDAQGRVQIAAPGAAGQGAEMDIVSLRPEKLVRLESERPDMISSAATVDDVLFLGDLVHYTATLSGGVTVKFQEHRGPGADVLRPAQPVRLGFLAEDALPISDG
ncbi:TOBE domain-containing protein, partial [Cribrihabitans sp. XS_ASV171]